MERPTRLLLHIGLLVGLFTAVIVASALALDLLFPRQVTVNGFISPVQEGFYSWRGRPLTSSPAVRMSITLPPLPGEGRLTLIEVQLENYLPVRLVGRVRVTLYEPGFVAIAEGSADVVLGSREARTIAIPLAWMEGKSNGSIWAMEVEFNGFGRRFF